MCIPDHKYTHYMLIHFRLGESVAKAFIGNSPRLPYGKVGRARRSNIRAARPLFHVATIQCSRMDIRRYRDGILRLATFHGAGKVLMIGSAVRGEATRASDLEPLVCRRVLLMI